MNRRDCFRFGGMTFGAWLAVQVPKQHKTVYQFAVAKYEIQMSVEYFDAYSTKGFSFLDRTGGHTFCLSASSQENRDCLPNFFGSLAIVEYSVKAGSNEADLIELREHVRTIDQDERLASRAPFEHTIKLERGAGSDIQAFGYYTSKPPTFRQMAAEPKGLWCFLRQDLYLNRADSPFLVIHWKHTLSAVRLLDVIPGDQTHLIAR